MLGRLVSLVMKGRASCCCGGATRVQAGGEIMAQEQGRVCVGSGGPNPRRVQRATSCDRRQDGRRDSLNRQGAVGAAGHVDVFVGRRS